ncbi:MAG: Crp/Fnr family transcriptional regulator [Sphaerochaeta sp.]|nr:Crp/Fnr family transcriptional regulator [Spirochaetales bacterium]
MEKRLHFTEEEVASFIKAGQARRARYAKDQIIALQGERCTTLDIILDGSVSTQNLDEEGRLFKAEVLNAGESCGATLLFGSNNTYPMQIVAQEPCTILHLKRELVLTLCESHKEVLLTLLAIISDRAHRLGTTVNRLSTLSLRESLLSYLHRLSGQQNSLRIILPITKKELAQRLGFARTSVSRELARLRDEKVLSMEGKIITLHTSSSSEE